MEKCGFPGIPRYLARQQVDTLEGANVTHVWAQDRKIAAHIAQAALIETVVDNFTDMIGQVDGVLLARDDAETHYELAAPFLETGIPIYVDKPLALTVNEARQLLGMQRYAGQLFSCSALRYAKEFQLSDVDLAQIGRLRHIHATAPKDWERYAVHVIEPLLLLAKERGIAERNQAWHEGDATTVAVAYSSGFQALISTLGSSSAPLAMRVFGDLGWKDLVFKDSYSAFRTALSEFIQGIVRREERIDQDFMLEVVSIIESGRKR